MLSVIDNLTGAHALCWCPRLHFRLLPSPLPGGSAFFRRIPPKSDRHLLLESPLQARVLTPVYNCAQIKLTVPRDGGSLWEMPFIISAGDRHDQEQDRE